MRLSRRPATPPCYGMLLAIRGIERDADEEHHNGEKEYAGEKLHAYSLPI
jgi:hypothetical protein